MNGYYIPALTLYPLFRQSDAAANTQESCTQYNILKIARSLFRWTGDAAYADFYERAILNGVLGVQRKPHSHAPSAAAAAAAHTHTHTHTHSHIPALGVELEAIAASNALHASSPRPANYKVVSWPDDPAAGIGATSVRDTAGPGQYIYYMPLGHEGGKGDNPKAWTHGWGDRFNTFWCCYGTAVESFSKMADSIYFRSSTGGGGGQGDSLSGGHGEGTAGPRRPPDLYINQIVSSKLTWRQLGVTLTQVAEMYADDNTARSTLRVSFSEPKSAENRDEKRYSGGGGGHSASAFYLHWRMPSWAAGGALRATLNRRPLDTAALLAGGEMPANATGGGGLLRFSPPQFGRGAKYITFGPDWRDGDTRECRIFFLSALESPLCSDLPLI